MADEAPKTEEVTVEPSPPNFAFVNADKRSMTVPLEYPLTTDGEFVREITIRRCVGNEVSDFIRRVFVDGEKMVPPYIECSLELWDQLDDDDKLAIDEAAEPFIPRRLLKFLESLDEQASTNGGNTSG